MRIHAPHSVAGVGGITHRCRSLSALQSNFSTLFLKLHGAFTGELGSPILHIAGLALNRASPVDFSFCHRSACRRADTEITEKRPEMALVWTTLQRANGRQDAGAKAF
jgi:hypothetical protein